VYLYDAEGHDREVGLTEGLLQSIGDRSLVWIDISARTEEEIRRVAEVLSLEAGSLDDLLEPKPKPRLDNYGSYFQFSLVPPPSAAVRELDDGSAPAENGEDAKTQTSEQSRIDFVVGERWLLTVHDEELSYLQGFRGQDKAETDIGALSPQALAASLLDWHLEAYFEEVARIELIVDRLDQYILAEPSSKSLLTRMAAVRRRISRVRKILVVQRPVFYGLSRPDVTKVAESTASSHYELLMSRFERAVDEVERTGELILGSFDLFTSRISQQTNDLVKTLTFFTVIIGCVAAVAGLFGMTFDPPFFRTGTAGFFAVTGGLLIVALAGWAWAKHKDWV
jgi:magnesium transporter